MALTAARFQLGVILAKGWDLLGEERPRETITGFGMKIAVFGSLVLFPQSRSSQPLGLDSVGTSNYQCHPVTPESVNPRGNLASSMLTCQHSSLPCLAFLHLDLPYIFP